MPFPLLAHFPSETDVKQAAVSMSSNFGQPLSDRQDRWISHPSGTPRVREIKCRLSICCTLPSAISALEKITAVLISKLDLSDTMVRH